MKLPMTIAIISQIQTQLSEMEVLKQSWGLVHQAELGQGSEVEPVAVQLHFPPCS